MVPPVACVFAIGVFLIVSVRAVDGMNSENLPEASVVAVSYIVEPVTSVAVTVAL